MSLNKELFHILESVDSTNNYAMGKVHEGSFGHGNACFSYEQTMGKGTRGRSWQSNKGENIIMSIVVNPFNLPISQQFYISAVAALSCYDLFSKYISDHLTIKWPNDLFWNDRKAAGILVENVIRGDKWQWSVIGIGMNINQVSFPPGMVKAVSLKQITGISYDIVELAQELYHLFFQRCKLLEVGIFDQLMTEYNDHLFNRGKQTRLKQGRVIFESTITGVSHDGKLNSEDVMSRSFDFNEVQIVVPE